MVVSEVTTQTQEITDFCDTYIEALETVSEKTTAIMFAFRMSGKGMDSIKSYLSTAYPSLCKAGILHGEALIQANKKYLEAYTSEFGSEELDSEELEEQIQAVSTTIAAYNQTKEHLTALDRELTDNPVDTMLSFVYRGMISVVNNGVTRNEEKKAKLEGKLQKFLAFCDASTGHFSEATATESLFHQGLQALGVGLNGTIGAGSWNGSGFSAYNTDWIKKVDQKWQTREQQLQEIKNKEMLEEYADIDANGNITNLHLSKLSELLWKAKDPESLSVEEKYVLLKIYQHMIDANTYEKALFEKLSGVITPILGFTYNEAGDYYYTNEHSLQSHGGFMDLFDEFGPLFGMDLDTEIIYFNANGKDYRLQLWKGSYGFGNAYGAEIGLYYKNTDGKELDTQLQSRIPGWYACVEDEDQLKMKNSIYDVKDLTLLLSNDTRDYAENEDHFWNLAIRTDNTHNKNNIMTISELEIPNKEMRENMYEALKNDKNIENIVIDGNVVKFKWKN